MPERTKSFKMVCSGGLNSNENHLRLAEIAPGAAIRLVNYEPSLFGGYRRLSGFEAYDSTYPGVDDGEDAAEGPVLGVAVFHNAGVGNPYVIAARKDTGASTYSFWEHVPLSGWTKMTGVPTRDYTDSGFTVSRVRHVQYDFGSGGEIAFVDGVNPLLIFNGTTWTEVPTASNDQALARPSVVEEFENHIFVAGDPTFPAVTAHSVPRDATDFTVAAGAGQVLSGTPIVTIKPFRENLFVFGENAIKKIAVDSSGSFFLKPVTTNIGCVARDSVQEIGGDLIFLAPDGFRPVASTSRIGDVEIETVSQNIRGRILQMIESFDLDTLVSVTVRSKNQLRVFVGDDNDATPLESVGIIGGLVNSQGQVGWEFGDLVGIRASCATSEYVNRQEYVLHGDYDGKVYRQDRGRSFAGEEYVSIYSTPFLDFGDTEVSKLIDKVNVFFRPEGGFSANISATFDWDAVEAVNPASYPIEIESAAVMYNGANILYGGSGVSYAGSSSPTTETDISGSGRGVGITIVSVSNTDFPHSIQGMVFEFLSAGRD